MYLVRQTFPAIWTVIAVIAPPRKFPEIRLGPLPPDVLSREMDERMRNVRALDPVPPMNHQEPSVEKQLSEDSTLRDS